MFFVLIDDKVGIMFGFFIMKFISLDGFFLIEKNFSLEFCLIKFLKVGWVVIWMWCLYFFLRIFLILRNGCVLFWELMIMIMMLSLGGLSDLILIVEVVCFWVGIFLKWVVIDLEDLEFELFGGGFSGIMCFVVVLRVLVRYFVWEVFLIEMFSWLLCLEILLWVL